MSAPLVLGSLCTGYGGLDLAAAAVLDAHPAWVADPDPGAAAVLAHRYPDVPNLGDITTVDFTAAAPVEVLCAGFPCQDISNAGRRAGIREGTRSGLWHTIADAIDLLRPRLLILENVRAIVSRRPGLDVVLADLARLRFDAEWTCLRASDVGAPHQRERWFLAAWPADTPSPRLQGPRLRRRATGGSGTAAYPDGVGDQWDRPTRQPTQRHPQSQGGAPAHTPGIGEREPADQTITLTAGRNTRAEPRRRGVQPAADPSRDGRHERRSEPAGIVGGSDAALGSGADVDWGGYGPAIQRWARILGRPAPAPRLPTGRNGTDQLNSVFVEWLMGLPTGWVTDVPGLTRNQQLKALGNGVVPAQGTAALAALLTTHDARSAA